MNAERELIKRNYYLYYLICPTDWEVRYIGVSCVLKTRYRWHINPNLFGSNKRKDAWIKGLLDQNLKPILIIVDVFGNGVDASHAEMEHCKKNLKTIYNGPLNRTNYLNVKRSTFKGY